MLSHYWSTWQINITRAAVIIETHYVTDDMFANVDGRRVQFKVTHFQFWT
jgi:hypothetical protein